MQVSAKTQTIDARVQDLVGEALRGTSMYVVEVDVRGARGSKVVDVFVDADEGVGVDQLAKVSRDVGFLLETEDIFESKYNLNVSSPGLERPLQIPRQYRKNIGRELVVEYTPDKDEREDEKSSAFAVGTLEGADEDSITLALSDEEHPEGGTRQIPYSQVRTARIRLPW